MWIFSQTYCVSSQTCHVVYLHNDISKDANIWQMKIQNFNFWNIIFWTKIQNTALFQYKTFQCCNFYFLNILYIHPWRNCFSMIRQYLFVQKTRACIIIVMKSNEFNIYIFLMRNICIRKKTRTLQQLNTHWPFWKLYKFKESHINWQM